MQGVEVKPVPTLRYFGVQLDQHLTGMKQIEHAQAKTTEMIAALGPIAGSTWGSPYLIPAKCTQQSYGRRSHLPVLHGLYRHRWGFKAAGNAARKALESIQHRALDRIAGAFRTTSRAALEICLNIPPPMIAMESAAKESYLRIATSPFMASLIEIRRSGQRPAPMNAKERRMRWFTNPGQDPLTSPLEQWGRLTTVSQNRLEVIHPHVTSPWWSGLKSHIAETQEDALAAHQTAVQSGADIIAYTDGSMTEQGVGAAVVSLLGRQAVHIGSPATHTVYAAELRGIEMALTQICNTSGPTSQYSHQTYTAIIFTDNQAAIQACSAPGRSSGQYILSEITRTASQLQERGWDIWLHWLPGHEGIYGNECADALAKGAAISPAPNDVEEPTLMASTRRALQIEAASAWKSEWAIPTHGNSLRRLWKEPSKAPMQLYQGLQRAASSILIHKQTGKIAQASYLVTFNAMELTGCSCGRGRQDIRYVLLH